MSNPIKKLTKAKVKGLIASIEESNAITHGGTIGSLREKYLFKFFEGILPNQFEIKSGFITDSFMSYTSPQVDLIICDKFLTPPFNLDEISSLVPIETTYLTAEIKSDLTSKCLEQLKSQNEIIKQLKFDFIHQEGYVNDWIGHFNHLKREFQVIEYSIQNSTDKNAQILKENLAYINNKMDAFLSTNHQKMQQEIKQPGIVVLAYDTSLSIDRLKEWFVELNSLLALCIINKSSILRLTEGITEIKNSGENEEVLGFAGNLYQALFTFHNSRKHLIPNWGKYLK